MRRSSVLHALALAVALTVTPAIGVSKHTLHRTQQPMPVTQAPALNHIYVVLDAATYAAIRDSRELAQLLGRTDGGLPDYAPPGPEADRVFFRGRQTYLEFFAPDNRFNEPVGKVGLALGLDEPAPFDALEDAWRATCGDQKRRTRVEWRRAQPPVPWYDAIQCDDTAAGSQLAVWAMVYRPEFQRWQSGAAADTPPRTARVDVLEPRRAEGQGRFDITGLAIDVDASLRAKLVKQLEHAGFERDDRPTGVRLRGQGWELLLRESDDSPKQISLVLETETRLTAPLTLGRASMHQSAEAAVVQFNLRIGD